MFFRVSLCLLSSLVGCEVFNGWLVTNALVHIGGWGSVQMAGFSVLASCRSLGSDLVQMTGFVITGAYDHIHSGCWVQNVILVCPHWLMVLFR